MGVLLRKAAGTAAGRCRPRSISRSDCLDGFEVSASGRDRLRLRCPESPGGRSIMADRSAPPLSVRLTVLVLMSIAMFGNYYVYDSIAPLADLLKKHLSFTDTQLGTLNAIYSLPNIVMVLIGGVIVDRAGARLAT